MIDTAHNVSVLPRPASGTAGDFYTYPPVGADDWRYTYPTAVVRALETQMLPQAALLDMAGAPGFEQAVQMLGSTEYALPQAAKNLAPLQRVLLERRKAVRRLFSELMIDRTVVELFRARDDFANLRLAIRRKLAGHPLGIDYSDEGNVRSERLVQILEQDDYEALPMYIQQAIEEAVLAYYQNKDIRQIDYSIDRFSAAYRLSRAYELDSVFLEGLFRIEIDLTNIRTMLRLKFAESGRRDLFLAGGFIELERLEDGLEAGYEGMPQLFFVTAYYELVNSAVSYLVSNQSFLKLEAGCQRHLGGFLKSTVQITAGPQPIIAYLLSKEQEIRTVRLILTAKSNAIDTQLIVDRLS